MFGDLVGSIEIPSGSTPRKSLLILGPHGGLRAVAGRKLIDCGTKIRGDLGVTETRLLLILYCVAAYGSFRRGKRAPKFSEKAGCFSNSYWRWFAMARGLDQRSV